MAQSSGFALRLVLAGLTPVAYASWDCTIEKLGCRELSLAADPFPGERPRSQTFHRILPARASPAIDLIVNVNSQDSSQASRLRRKTGVGCDGFHPKVPLDLTRETRGEVVEFLEKVE